MNSGNMFFSGVAGACSETRTDDMGGEQRYDLAGAQPRDFAAKVGFRTSPCAVGAPLATFSR
jgi:hypothetical protein